MARRCKAALQALGPLEGMRFAAREVTGRKAELPVSIADSGKQHTVWVRPHSTDIAIFTQIFRWKEYDFSRWSPYADHLKSCYEDIIAAGKVPVIVDGGANAGYSPIWFSLRFPRARVIAVEPDRENFALLKRNVASFPNIVSVEAALWDEKTLVSILDPNASAWARRFEVAHNGIGMPSITVPELLHERDDYVPFIMKIDIEGAETKLFRSNTDWIDNFPLVVFEAHDSLYEWLGPWQGSAHSFFSTLARRRREYLMHGENIFAFLHPEGASDLRPAANSPAPAP